MKLTQLVEDGVLDYKGDVYHPATPQGAPTNLGRGVAGAGTDMSPEDPEETLLQKSKKKVKTRKNKKKG